MEVSGQLHAPAAGSCGEETNLAPARNRAPAVQSVARRYAELSRLLCSNGAMLWNYIKGHSTRNSIGAHSNFIFNYLRIEKNGRMNE
jgi:hypothetical protein